MNWRRSKLISGVLILSLLFLSIAPCITFATPQQASTNQEKPSPNRKKDVKKLIEIEEKRDQHTKYYLNSDGSYSAEVQVNSRHYKDGQGKWQDISNRLMQSDEPGFSLSNEANQFKTHFANNSQSQSLVKVKTDANRFISWNMQGANRVFAVNDTYSVTYPEILPGIDLQYQPFSDGLKEDIVLKNSETQNSFEFELHANGVYLVQRNDGGIDVVDAQSDEVTLILPKPFMYDANHITSPDVTMSLAPTQNPNIYLLTITADATWLNDPSRAYPVIVDPGVTTLNWSTTVGANGIDTYIASNSSYQYYTSTYMTTGKDVNLGYTRAFVKFALPTLPAGSIVTDGVFSIYKYTTASTPSDVLNVFRVTNNWDPTTITWANQPPVDSNNNITETVATSVPGGYTGWVDFNVWSIAKYWLNGNQQNPPPFNNYGFMIRHNNEDDPLFFYYTSNNGTNQPTLSITYITDQTGLNPYWSYANTPIGSVNTFNGNLLTSAADYSLPGRGVPIGVTRTYNSRGSLNGLFGQKWFSNLDMQLVFSSWGATLLDSAGTERPFMYNTGHTAFIAPDNYPVQLYIDTGGGSTVYKLQEANETGTYQSKLPTVFFDSTGKLTQLTDGKGNSTTITRNTGNIVVTDASGRQVTLYLNGDGTVNRIVDNQSIEKVHYNYSNGYLTSVVYKDSVTQDTTVSYGWQRGLLYSLTDKNGTPNYITYNTSNQAVSVGAINYAMNPSFEASSSSSAVDNWTAYNSATLTRDTSQHYFGSASLKHTVTSASGDNYVAGARLTVPSSNTYAFSAYINIPSQISGSAYLRVVQFNSGGSVVSDTNVTTGINSTSGWQRISGTFTTASNTEQVELRLMVNNIGIVYWDGVQLEKSATVSKFLGHTDFRYGTDQSFQAAWVTTPAGEVTEYRNDNYGTPAAVIRDPGNLNIETDFIWDPQDRLRSLTTPNHVHNATDKHYTYGYDPWGNMTWATDPASRTTNYSYYLNRLKTLTMADTSTVQNVWDPGNLNNVGNIDQSLNSTAYSYDSSGNVVAQSNQLGIVDNKVFNSNFEKASPMSTFTRNSTAFTSGGTQVGTNQPRYEAGKFAQSLTVEEGTTNLIPSAKQNFTGWTAYSGASVTLTQNQSVAEWNTSSATRIQTSGGTDTSKYYLVVVSPSTNGQKYSHQLRVKNNGTNTVRIYANNGNYKDVAAGQSTTVNVSETGDSIHNAGIIFAALNASNSLDFYAYQPQTEAINYSTSFIGSSRANESLTVPTTSILSPTSGTVEMWVKVNSLIKDTSAHRYIFSTGSGSGPYPNAIALRHRTDNYWSFWTTDSSGTMSEVAVSDTLSLGWHHFAVKWSASAIDLYIDGVKKGSVSAPHIPSSLSSTVNIGSWITSYGWINTQIDDFRVSAIAKSDSEILADATNGQPMPVDATTTNKLSFDNSLSSPVYQPESWTPFTPAGSINRVIYDSTAPFGGSNVLHINAGSNYDAYQWTDYISLGTIDSSTTFTISGYLRALQGQGSNSDGAALNVYWFDSSQTLIKTDQLFNVKTDSWQRYVTTLKPPSNAVYARVMAITYESYDGYFDNIQFEKSTDAKEYNFLDNSAFENQSTKWYKSDSYTNTYSDSDAYDKKLGGSYDGQINRPSSGTSYFESQSVLPIKSEQSYTLAGWIKTGTISGGGGRLHVILYNTAGTQVGEYATNYVTNSLSDWSQYAVGFTASTTGTAKVRLESTAVGLVKFDDIRFSPGNMVSTNSFDSNKNYVVSSTNQLQHTTNLVNNNYGQVTTVTLPGEESTQYSYDGQERLKTVTDNAGNVTTYTLDNNGNVLNVALVAGTTTYNSTAFSYDSLNNLQSETDANNNVTSFTYDEEGRLVSKSNPNGTTVSVGYDSAGRHNQTSLSNGPLYNYTYDWDGNRTGQTVTVGGNVTYQTLYAYDDVNHMTSYIEKDGNGNIQGQVNNQSYSSVDQLQGFSLVYNGVTIPYNFTYSKVNLPTSVKVDNGNEIDFTYDDSNNLIYRSNPNSTRDIYTYNEANQVIGSQTVGFATSGTSGYSTSTLTPKWSSQYTYNSNGMLTQVTGTGAGSPNATYTYNNGTEKLNRLTQANITAAGTNYTFNYTYDPAGNILSMAVPSGSSTTTKTFQYDADNQIINNTDFIYNANGNLLTAKLNGINYTYTYDSANRLISVVGGGKTTTYTYDGDGLRLSKTVNGTTTNYHYFNGHLMYETVGTTITALYMRSSSGALQGVRLHQDSTDNYYYYHYNAQGDVTAVTDAGGNVYRQYFYDPYGNVIKVLDGSGNSVDINTDTGFNNAYTYRGYRYDSESGLYFLNARYYAAGIGRFLTKDPFKGLATDPGSLNRYAYCEGDPINFSDPSGFGIFDFIWQAVTDIVDSFLSGVADDVPIAGYDYGSGLSDFPTGLVAADSGGSVSNSTSPPSSAGYKPPKTKGSVQPKKAANGQVGWPDKSGNVWVPVPAGHPLAHGGEHWDVQYPNGGYDNVYPNGSVRKGKGGRGTFSPSGARFSTMDLVLVGGALVVYGIVSEGTRVFPARNLVPVP